MIRSGTREKLARIAEDEEAGAEGEFQDLESQETGAQPQRSKLTMSELIRKIQPCETYSELMECLNTRAIVPIRQAKENLCATIKTTGGPGNITAINKIFKLTLPFFKFYQPAIIESPGSNKSTVTPDSLTAWVLSNVVPTYNSFKRQAEAEGAEEKSMVADLDLLLSGKMPDTKAEIVVFRCLQLLLLILHVNTSKSSSGKECAFDEASARKIRTRIQTQIDDILPPPQYHAGAGASFMPPSPSPTSSPQASPQQPRPSNSKTTGPTFS